MPASPAETMCVPERSTTHDRTIWPSPGNTRRAPLVSRSQTRQVPSFPAVTLRFRQEGEAPHLGTVSTDPDR